MNAAEFVSRLGADAKPRKTATGWQARCPAHDDKEPSLSIGQGADGRVLIDCKGGCKTPDICAALGLTMRDLFASNGHANGSLARSKPASVFDWGKCVADFTDEHAQRLAAWRVLSIEFVRWLQAQGIIGIFEGKTAFANHGHGGKVVSAHLRLEETGKWIFKPTGHKAAPLIFGDTQRAGYVLTFESQWDAFAVMDKLGWHTSNVPDNAVLITRGASNGKLIRSHVSADAICYAFTQNDKAGQTWLADIASNAGCRVLNVATPAPHKDCNDWTRAGATEADLQAAMKAAKPVEAPPARIEVSAPDGEGLDKITSDLRGDILRILTNEETSAATQRREICERVIAALHHVGRFYFHADLKDFDSALFFNRCTKRLERIRADSFLSWLSDWTCTNRADAVFKFIVAAVETESLNESRSTGIIPESFWASRPGAIYISSGDGQAVKITAAGIDTVDNGCDSVLFYAGKTCAPWQLTGPGDIFQSCAIFRDIHASAGHAPDLLRAWIYSLPTIPKCKPPLLLVGEVGAGKTALAKAISQFYGIPPAISKVEEMTESHFWPCANDGGIYTLDNADTKTSWLADTVAAAATDGISKRRKLYCDSESIVLKPRAWLILTSSNPTFGGDSGLSDRLLVCRMERRDSESSDSALADEITANRSAGLSHLAETIHKALADTATTPGGLNQRHPDFASFAVRIGRALGRETEMVAAMKTAEADKSAFCLENDFVGSALLAALADGQPFTGTANELRTKLIESDAEISSMAENGKFSAKRLGKRIVALWPHLKKQLARKSSVVY